MALPLQQRLLPPDLATDLVNPRRVKDPAVGYLTVPAVLVRVLLPLVAVTAVFLFLRGHDAPGGGFVAGLVVSIGILLQYMVSGTEWVEERVRIAPRKTIAAGMFFSLAASAGAFILYDRPLLTGGALHLTVPVIGELHLTSATLFDLGVFALVLGATLFMLVAIAHQSVRAHREAEGE
jgi:multicomponent K+:H+ antiporter subunit A